MSIRELTALVKPPSRPTDVPKRPAWKPVEKLIGTAFPKDFKNFIAAFGSGTLGHFVIVLNPFSQVEGFEFFSGAGLLCDTLRTLEEFEGGRQVPFDVHPARPGLLPWGGDENGNGLYWLTDGKPDTWPCVVGEGRGKPWQKFDLPMTSFLAAIYRGEVRCKIWPRGYPRKRDLVFEPL